MTNLLLDGLVEPAPERVPLRAGPLALAYADGGLRAIRLGEHEIIQRIYVAVRDRNWGTVPARLSEVRIQSTADTFEIAFQAEHCQGDIHFIWAGTISGGADGAIRLAMNGLARTTFLRNRIGICVLYPAAECTGAPCAVEHVDGAREAGSFPRLIAARQPFVDIRAFTHQVGPGLLTELRFAGDTFEMEDQRNWTDGSFKIYGTPLRLPFPAEVAAGTIVRQAVTLRLLPEWPTGVGRSANRRMPGAAGQTVPSAADVPSPGRPGAPVELRPTGATTALPAIGLALASHGHALAGQELAWLSELHPAHLHAELWLHADRWAADLARAAAEARALGVKLQLALAVPDDAETALRALRRQLDALQPAVCAFLVFGASSFVTTPELASAAREILSGYKWVAPIGGGTNANFAELNRNRPPLELLDLVGYSINPQVHAFDNTSLIENLAPQAATVASARAFCGDRPLAVGPVTLRPRFNAVATEPSDPASTADQRADARQFALVGAAWTVGSIKYLAEAGAHGLTYYETTGGCGVMPSGSAPPIEQLAAVQAVVFPLYHVLADVGSFAGGTVVAIESSAPSRCEGLVLRKGPRTRALIANLTAEPQRVRAHLGMPAVKALVLDQRSLPTAMRDPACFRAQAARVAAPAGVVELELPPYAVVRIDDVAGV